MDARGLVSSLLAVACLGACQGTRHTGNEEGGTCGACAEELAGVRRELAQLRVEIQALSRRSASSGSTPPPGVAAPADQTAQAERSATVTLTFSVKPEGAAIRVDGTLLSGATWTGPRTDQPKLVRVQKAGYLIAEQAVTPDRDRVLEYRLMRGRGMQQLPARTGP